MKFIATKKLIMSIVIYLIPFSLFGVGFSTWIIGKAEDELLITGIMNADDVIDSSEYITKNALKGYENSGVDALQYNSNGLVLDDVVGDTGQMKYYLIFQMKKFYEDYIQYDYVNMSFVYSVSLTSDNSAIFDYLSESVSVNYLFGNTGNYTDTLKEISSSSIINTSTKSINTSISLIDFDKTTYNSSLSGKIMYMEVTYNFKVDASTYSSLYNELNEKNINFQFNVFIEGCDVNEAS